MRNCWEEEPNSRPEFDAIVVRLDCAQKELSVYDNQDSVNLQTTMRKQVCGMLEDLKEKAGELRTKEVALKEQEMALLRRHVSLKAKKSTSMILSFNNTFEYSQLTFLQD